MLEIAQNSPIFCMTGNLSDTPPPLAPPPHPAHIARGEWSGKRYGAPRVTIPRLGAPPSRAGGGRCRRQALAVTAGPGGAK